jgi:hypothetical protein
MCKNIWTFANKNEQNVEEKYDLTNRWILESYITKS